MDMHPSVVGCTRALCLAFALVSGAAMGNHYILCQQNKDKCVFEASRAYISNYESNDVTVVDTATATVVAVVDVGKPASTVAVNPVAQRAYAADSRNVTVIDTATDQVIANIPYNDIGLPLSTAAAINATGTRLYVTDVGHGGIAVIDTATNAVIAHVFTRHQHFGIAVSPDGSRVYATSVYDDYVTVFDTATNTVVADIAIDNPYYSPPILAGDFSAGPLGIAVNPAGTRVYVANVFLRDNASLNFYVSVIDTSSNTIIANVPTGPVEPRGIAMNASGTRVYLSSGAVIDTATNAVIGTIPASSRGLAFDPIGGRILAPREEPPSLLIIDVQTGVVVQSVPLDGTPFAFGQFVGGQ